MPTLTEKNVETLIHEHLRERGWPITDCGVITKGFKEGLGGQEADYAILRDGRPAAFIEAKRPGKDLWAALDQPRGYARAYRARQRLYAFRPYRYGPFAGEIYDHLAVLEGEGLLRQRQSGGSSERDWLAIELTAKGRDYAEKILPAFDPDLVSELHEVALEYAGLGHDALLDTGLQGIPGVRAQERPRPVSGVGREDATPDGRRMTIDEGRAWART